MTCINRKQIPPRETHRQAVQVRLALDRNFLRDMRRSIITII